MDEIRDEAAYRTWFPTTDILQASCSRELQLSLETRKFEIELYWKRAAYFWTLIAAAFSGFFALSAKGNSGNLVFLVSCLGFLLSLGWYLVNRGSKYWQENWERHVDMLVSRDGFGPLFATTISHDGHLWFKFWRGYRYSVSRINQLISLFVVLIWGGLVILEFPLVPLKKSLLPLAPWILAGGTVVFACLILWLGRSGSQTSDRTINFRVVSLQATERK